MSEPRLISPLLDGFAMGAPISSHHGVRCCPAMKKNSDNKYIVKVISIPASQTQLDALLLTKAYKDPGEAMDYFKELADGIVSDAELLLSLTKLEGFLCYEGWQVVPMEDNRLGYQVYLIGSYKRSLERHIRRNLISPEDAPKLALDICTALSACRRAGFLYIDLKPSNIFISDDNEYRIGDLGFVALDSVKYYSLPAKYRSPYSAPETVDSMETLNLTADTYALGMILYQIYNEGQLPTLSQEEQKIPAPPQADESMSAIILKAIAANPAERWEDPSQMGHAIVAYLNQARGAKSDDLSANQDSVISDTQVFSTEAVNDALEEQANDKTPDIASTTQDSDTKVLPTNQILTTLTKETRVIPTSDIAAALSAQSESSTTVPNTVHAADTKVLPALEQNNIVSSAPVPTAMEASEKHNADEPPRVLTAVASSVSDLEEKEPVVSASTRVIPAGSRVSDESSPRHKTVPEKAVDLVPPVTRKKLTFSDENDAAPTNTLVKKVAAEDTPRPRKKIGKGIIAIAIVAILLSAALYGGYYYYQNTYLQSVHSFEIIGEYNALTVLIDTEADESLLTVSCSDTYGNVMRKKLTNGSVEFTDLLPNSQYKLLLEIDGFHQLVGKTSDVYNTASRTDIVSFTGITGAEDGSVMLTFTVDGPEPEKWVVTYTAEGEEEKSQTFSGHSITVKELAVNKLYTFRLSPAEEMYISGQTTLEFTSSSLILAQNLTITACDNNEMTIRWDTPANAEISAWVVRCYGEDGYDQTIETTENKAVFSDVNPVRPYHVEVTASGMTQSVRTSLTANPITITSFNVNNEESDTFTVSWDYRGLAPTGGWLLMYSLDGSNTQSVVKCEKASAMISPKIFGAEYQFTIQAADNTSIFSNIHAYTVPNPAPYDSHSFDAGKVIAYMVPTPEKEGWTTADLSTDDYTDKFKPGQKASVVLYCPARFYIPEDNLSVLYVFRNSEGQVISKLISQGTVDWHNLWVRYNVNYGELDLPVMPEELGDYSVSIYFDGKAITTTTFSIVE